MENKTELSFGSVELLKYLPHRYPYLLVDYVSDVVPSKSIKGYKNLTVNEWFFQCHFEGDPLMPGMLQIEALLQLGALIVLTLPEHSGMKAYVTEVNNAKFFNKVLPGERFDMECTATSYKRGVLKSVGNGYVEGVQVCRVEFTIVFPEILKKLSPH